MNMRKVVNKVSIKSAELNAKLAACVTPAQVSEFLASKEYQRMKRWFVKQLKVSGKYKIRCNKIQQEV